MEARQPLPHFGVRASRPESKALFPDEN